MNKFYRGCFMLKEFKKFITEGSVMDLAVAVIMGAAVKEMVDGLINGLIAPLIGAATAGVNMKEMAVTLAGVKLQYGLFLDALVMHQGLANSRTPCFCRPN